MNNVINVFIMIFNALVTFGGCKRITVLFQKLVNKGRDLSIYKMNYTQGTKLRMTTKPKATKQHLKGGCAYVFK